MLVLNLKIEKIHLQTNALMTYMFTTTQNIAIMNGSEPSVQSCVFQRESHLQGVCKLGSFAF